MSEKRNTNVSFILLPFQFDIDNAYGGSLYNACEELAQGPNWMFQTDRIDYMFRYVTDKIINEDLERRQCFHYKWGQTDSTLYHFKKSPVQFQIHGEEFFAFSTGIGLYAFQICFIPEHDHEYIDIRTISSALFYLKNAAHEFKTPDDEKQTFLGIASAHCRILGKNSFFFHTGHDSRLNKRTNVLSLSLQPGAAGYDENGFSEELRRDMYHYRYCYGNGFHYVRDRESEKRELVAFTREIVWGLSDEAMVAAAYPEMYPDCEKFIRNIFYDNFISNYLFMYAFLLHQKYVLYHFMTELGSRTYSKLEDLQDYSRKLYRFETDFEYSRISDVPQYERLYEMQVDTLDIPRLFRDVREPLEALRLEEEQLEAQQQSNRENRMNRMLAWVGVLAIFSALTDSFDFAEKVLNIFPAPLWVIRSVQILLIAGIFVVAGFVIKESVALLKERYRK